MTRVLARTNSALLPRVSGATAARVDPTGSTSEDASLADWLADFLLEQGIQEAFGLIGGAVAPLCEALVRSGIRVVQFRHETGAVFAAMEAYFATGRPVALFTTTGPGLTNAITGIAAARAEGAKVVLFSGTTPSAKRGRGAFQETGPYSALWPELYRPGALFHFGAAIESAKELPHIAMRLAGGLARAGGFVAHVGIPIDLQTAPVPAAIKVGGLRARKEQMNPVVLQDCVEALSSGEFAIWVGFGARDAWREVRELARRTGAPVICTPRAKGIFPESHPQHMGVSGFAGHQKVHDYMRSSRPARLLVLGTRLGEFSSFWDPLLVPERGFVHVDVDPDVPGAAYPEVETLAVQADIGAFLRALMPHADRLRGTRPRASLLPKSVEAVVPSASAVRPSYLMQVIQRVVVDSGVPILTEAGNSFAWANHYLKFESARAYRVSMSFASMGHSTAGVVGAALASNAKAVAIAGDGSMLMTNEISTAVALGAPAVWIVLNDSQYGMIEHGMRAQGFDPVDTTIPRTDFVAIAKAEGADGVRVEREIDVASALERAMFCQGPFVVDVWIDPHERAPFLRRIESLMEQGAQPLKARET